MGKTTTIKHPCRDCLLTSVCKQKKWENLIVDCDTLYHYIFRSSESSTVPIQRVDRTFHELFPNTWKPASPTAGTLVYEGRVIKQ